MAVLCIRRVPWGPPSTLRQLGLRECRGSGTWERLEASAKMQMGLGRAEYKHFLGADPLKAVFEKRILKFTVCFGDNPIKLGAVEKWGRRGEKTLRSIIMNTQTQWATYFQYRRDTLENTVLNTTCNHEQHIASKIWTQTSQAISFSFSRTLITFHVLYSDVELMPTILDKQVVECSLRYGKFYRIVLV